MQNGAPKPTMCVFPGHGLGDRTAGLTSRKHSGMTLAALLPIAGRLPAALGITTLLMSNLEGVGSKLRSMELGHFSRSSRAYAELPEFLLQQPLQSVSAYAAE